VKVNVDVDGYNKSVLIKKDCKVYNTNGDEMIEFIGKYNVDVKIDVAKVVPLTVKTNGRPASDYVLKNVSVEPESVLITGAPEILDNINELTVETVNIDGLSEDAKIQSNIILPDGVQLYNSPAQVDVNVEIEPFEIKEFDITRNDINVVNNGFYNNLRIEIITNKITVKIKGPREELDGIDKESLLPTIYINFTDAGLHKVPLNLVIPSSVRLIENYSIDVRVTDLEAERGSNTDNNGENSGGTGIDNASDNNNDENDNTDTEENEETPQASPSPSPNQEDVAN